MRVTAYQHGLFPRTEEVVAATRGLDRGRTSAADVEAAYAGDQAAFVALQEEAGLDYYSDGLLRWQDIFRPLVDAAGGLDATTLVRWFDNNAFFRAPETTGGDIALAAVPESLLDGAGVPGPRVATLPSPYMFSRAAQTSGDRDELMVRLAQEVLRPAAAAMSARGARVVHLQEPWLVYFRGDVDWTGFELALEHIRGGLAPGTTLVLHTYYGDAAPLIDNLRALPVDVLGVDFVETDLAGLGSGWEVGIVAGCIDSRSSPLESAEGTAAFLVKVVEALQPPVLVVSSTGDLDRLPTPLAQNKVRLLGQVAQSVKEALR